MKLADATKGLQKVTVQFQTHDSSASKFVMTTYVEQRRNELFTYS